MKDNQCHHCGRFSRYEEMDSYTPYGCADPGNPEPFDPTYLCKKCSQKLKKRFLAQFKNGQYKTGHWSKSDAEREAAKESNLVWIENDSRLKIDGRYLFNEYVPKEVYDKLIDLF